MSISGLSVATSSLGTEWRGKAGNLKWAYRPHESSVRCISHSPLMKKRKRSRDEAFVCCKVFRYYRITVCLFCFFYIYLKNTFFFFFFWQHGVHDYSRVSLGPWDRSFKSTNVTIINSFMHRVHEGCLFFYFLFISFYLFIYFLCKSHQTISVI